MEIKFEATKKILKDVKQTCKKHEVQLILSDCRSVQLDTGTKCNGYFEDKTPALAVACGQAEKKWLPVLIHESSHMDQWIEQCVEWTNTKTEQYESMDLLDLWMGRHIELSRAQLNKYVKASRDVELDCEKRSVEKILHYDAPLNIVQYIQRANAYVYFYNFMKVSRKWYTIGKEPYNVKDVWTQMPINFDNDYEKLPKKFRDLFLNYL